MGSLVYNQKFSIGDFDIITRRFQQSIEGYCFTIFFITDMVNCIKIKLKYLSTRCSCSNNESVIRLVQNIYSMIICSINRYIYCFHFFS